MDISQKILSDITIYSKYARYIPTKNRRETWEEIVNRNKEMHLKKFPDLAAEINDAYNLVYEKKILPSMRSMQFAGKSIELNPARMYNCSYQPLDDYRAFSEGMFLLLSGVGYGFSVQRHHVDQLPEIRKSTKERRFLIGDSIEGWSDAVRALIKSYLVGGSRPRFDFGDIRPKGMRLITSGGKAPGPEPLKLCLAHIEAILDRKDNGQKLSPLECHDIMCHIAIAVLSGGIRRSAMISLFSIDDEEMITCKYGNWFELNPQRQMANNSIVVDIAQIKESEFRNLWEKIEFSNAGEPGIYFTHNVEYGTNPCVETSLRPNSFCNLVEQNGNTIDVDSPEDFYDRCKKSAFINTLQAAYTDFHYLRPKWQINTEKDSLIGVGITGIASNKIKNEWLETGAQIVKDENERVAKIIGIKPSARCTVIKPSGTTSCVLGCSSGIHGWHSKYYFRSLRFNKNESIVHFLKEKHPELIEDEFYKPKEVAVVSVPQKSPDNSIMRDEPVLDFLERIKLYNLNWVRPGHRSGPNFHNVSATIYIKPDEWESVGNWIWENRMNYHGLSAFPYDGGVYKQAPFQECTQEEYEDAMVKLKDIDLSTIIELEDETTLSAEAACAGGICEL